MAFNIGHIPPSFRSSDVVRIRDPAQTNQLQVGDIVESWDRFFVWDNDCVPASVLEEWRAIADTLCDDALQTLFPSSSSSVGIDLLKVLRSSVTTLDANDPAKVFYSEVMQAPPAGIAASPEEISRAQAFFFSYAMPITQSLMHFSLAGGFASPRITRTLQIVSYLVPPASKSKATSQMDVSQVVQERTYSRLLETLQFVLEVMGCNISSPGAPLPCLTPGGYGWESCIRVRMLHGVARRRIFERAKASNSLEKVLADGQPINQEDMAATLASFSIAPLSCLERLGYRISREQKKDFIALWRHIGFYLGVSPDILQSHFRDIEASEKFLASTVVHLLEFNRDGADIPLPPTIPILRAISDRPPFPTPFAYHAALSRYLLGPSLSDVVGIPQTPWLTSISLHTTLFISRIPKLFGDIYPRGGWERQRVTIVREGMARLVRFQMGMKRTTFRARTDDGDIVETEDERVVKDEKGARQLMKSWSRLTMEMMTVIGAAVICMGWFGIRTFQRW